MIEFQKSSSSNNSNKKKLKTKAAAHLMSLNPSSSLLSQNNTPEPASIDTVEKHILSLSTNFEEKNKVNKGNIAWETVRSVNPKPIGLLNNGDLPDLDLPAELDEHKIGTFVEYADDDDDDEDMTWIPFSMREKSGKRKLINKKNDGKAKKSSKKKNGENEDDDDDDDVENDKSVKKAEKALEEANSIDENELFNYLSNI